MRFLLLLAVLTYAVVFTGCLERPGIVVRKELPRANSISHVFKFGAKKLRDTIPKIFELKEQLSNPYLTKVFYYYFPENDTTAYHKHELTFSAETNEDAVFGNEYFLNSGRLNDIYLKQYEYWSSPFYFVSGKPLLYTTDYVLVFDSLEQHETKITVKATDPTVVNGEASWGAHGPVANLQKVQSTTIEEHQLLLFIADKLGDKTVESTLWPMK